MNWLKKIAIAMMFGLVSTSCFAMTPEQMVNRVVEIGQDVVQDGNAVEFNIKGIKVLLIYDENADRMRLVSAIADIKEVNDDVLLMAMEANFHSVLDARYAISNEIVWSIFVHPLTDLTPALFDSAIGQVVIAHATFGGDFVSGAMIFPNRAQ